MTGAETPATAACSWKISQWSQRKEEFQRGITTILATVLRKGIAGECYTMQTPRMTEMGLAPERMLEECAKAGAYRLPCTQSIGRDLSHQARLGEAQSVVQKCELAQDENRLACIRGVVYALIDRTWNGRYAMPFCAIFGSTTDRDNCLKLSVDYLRMVFEKSADDIAEDCSRYAASSRRCIDVVAVSEPATGF
jgi:hypothetical protein